jgi:ubiquinone/menaquinone biosynthesis C-methylase UbiE
LSKLNAMTNASFIRYLGLSNGLQICDFGCGLGNLMIDITQLYPSVHITGLEISERQYQTARANTQNDHHIMVINTDIFRNNLPDDYFDITYCRYVLEHVKDPLKAVKEMVRVTKPGGMVVSQENDLHNVLYYPEIGGMEWVMKQFCQLQKILGGDPYIGRKLFDIYHEASLQDIQLAYEPEIYTENDRESYRAWMENSLNILLGAKEELIDRNLIEEQIIETVCDIMRRRIKEPKGVALFHWNRVKGRK